MIETILTILMYFASCVIILVVATLIFNIAIFLFKTMEDIADYYEKRN